MEIVKADNLVKYYGSGDSLVKAVDHVGLSVRKGEFVAVVGTSGSGKTTLLNLLGGLDYADEGTVLVDGQDITRMKEEELTVFRRRNIGFVFQSYNLVTVLNVEKNITLPIRLDGNRVDEEYIGGITSALGISDKRKAFPNQLSGGQQQRVAIARAIAGKPSVIFLCQVGTKKKLRIYKPFIGGQPPVNGLRFSMLFCRSLCDVSYTPLQTPPSSE